MDKKDVIKWNDDKSGYKKHNSGGGKIYKRLYSIELQIMSYCTILINSPEKWKNNEKVKYRRFGCFQPIERTYPLLSYYEMDKIYDEIEKLVPQKLEDIIKTLDIRNPSLSNFEFLALLGKERNWKEGCAICLAEKIMGTSCTCGHTEISVFRPCGHTLCNKPCFVDFMKSKKYQSKPKTFTTRDGEKLTVVGAFESETNFEFVCPLCTQTVTNTFQAQDICFECDIFDVKMLAEKIATTCDISLYDKHDNYGNEMIVGKDIEVLEKTSSLF